MAGARNVMDPRSTRRARIFFIHGGQDFLVATLEIFGGNLCLDVADARNQSSELIYGAHGEHRIILQVKAS